MKKLILSFVSLASILTMTAASAVPVYLVTHNQRSDSGTLSTLIWDGSNAANPWAIANGVTASTATWDWNAGTGVLTSTGRFETTSHLSSNPAGFAVIDDRVVDLVIDTANGITTATSYNCVEGNFLALVGVHGCANVGTGDNGIYDGSVAYNVGGDATCLSRTIGGDDVSFGGPRGLTGDAPCDPTSGSFDLFTVSLSGTQLILSNGVAFGSPGANWLTFSTVPVPAGVWLFGSALGVLGWTRRRANR